MTDITRRAAALVAHYGEEAAVARLREDAAVAMRDVRIARETGRHHMVRGLVRLHNALHQEANHIELDGAGHLDLPVVRTSTDSQAVVT